MEMTVCSTDIQLRFVQFFVFSPHWLKASWETLTQPHLLELWTDVSHQRIQAGEDERGLLHGGFEELLEMRFDELLESRDGEGFAADEMKHGANIVETFWCKGKSEDGDTESMEKIFMMRFSWGLETGNDKINDFAPIVFTLIIMEMRILTQYSHDDFHDLSLDNASLFIAEPRRKPTHRPMDVQLHLTIVSMRLQFRCWQARINQHNKRCFYDELNQTDDYFFAGVGFGRTKMK